MLEAARVPRFQPHRRPIDGGNRIQSSADKSWMMIIGPAPELPTDSGPYPIPNNKRCKTHAKLQLNTFKLFFDSSYALRSVVRPLVQPEPGHPRIEFLTRLRPDARLYALRHPGVGPTRNGAAGSTPLSGGAVVGTVAGGRRLHLWSAAAGPLEGTGVPVVGRRCGSAGQGGGRRG